MVPITMCEPMNQKSADIVWAKMYTMDGLHYTFKAVKPMVSITTCGPVNHKSADIAWAGMHTAEGLYCTYKAVKPEVLIITCGPVNKDPFGSHGRGCIQRTGYTARTQR